MITPITLIKLNEQSDNVANLHAALKALDLAVEAKEVSERRGGDSTLKVVRAFQKERQLRFDEKLLVDEPTAAAMNKLLTERGQFTPAPVVEVNRDLIVKGTITTANGNSLRDLVVVAFDQDLRSRQELGSTRAGANGEYSISYGAAQFAKAEKESADLVVEVRSPRGEMLHATGILFNAPAVAEMDIALNSSPEQSEFERIKAGIDPLIDGKDITLASLEENEQFKDVTFIGGETGIEKEKVAHFIVAHKLVGRSKLDPEFWYSLLEGQVFSGALSSANGISTLEENAQKVVAALASTKVESVETALNTSLADNRINARLAGSVPAWLKQYRAFAAAQALTSGGANAPSELKQLLDLSGVAEAKQTKFAQYYVEVGSDRNEVIKRLRKDKTFSPAEVTNIEKTLVLNDLTFGSVPLVKTLGERVKDASSIRELAKTRREDWEALLQINPRGQISAAPDFIAGTTPAEKAGNYAALLTERFQSEYPTAAFAGGLERAMRNKEPLALKHADKLVEFLNANPAFELHTTAVESFVEKKTKGRAPNSKDQESFTQELKAAQRVFKLNKSFEATNTLLADGVHSAQQVYRMGETKFVRQYANRPGFTEASAHAAFQRAANTQAAVVTIVGQLAAAQNANAVQALANNSAALNDFPNLQNLFGKADICECEHCRSVYSPAAYFADLLMFLQARDSVTPGVSVKDVLFQRRPDLGFLELSCENSNTPLPYVDLACEVLEDRVKPWHLFNLPLTLAPSLIKGTVSAAVQTAFSGATPSVALSGEAIVSERFPADYWVIRDLSETYLVQTVAATSGANPLPARLSVSILRQTHNTAEELAANPEYVNEAAYTELSNAKYPFRLPFNLFAEELRAYMGKVNVRRADLMEVFRGNSAPNNPTALDIAAEYFGIAKAEQNLILQADNANQFVYWGEANNANMLTNVRRVDVFLRKTGLEYNDLLKLLSLKFINLSVAHLDSSCDTNQKLIQVLNVAKLDRVHRFLRLWRKLGWPMSDVDLVISNPLIGNNAIDSGFIQRLKPFAELKAKFPSLTVEQLCGFFDQLSTTPKFSESYKKPEPSVYERMFLNKQLNSPLDASFEVAAVNAPPPTATIGAHLPPILAALKIREADLTVFLNLKRPGNVAAYLPKNLLSLANLSMLYRHTQLARLLKLKATEWQTLLHLAQLDPFQSTQATLDFVTMVERVRASKFSIDELSYVLSADLTVKPAQAKKNTTSFLTKLRAELKKMAAEYETSALPNDAQALSQILTGLLQKLNRPPEVITGIVELMNDQNVSTFHLAKPLPANFAFPAAITNVIKIAYDPVNQNLSFTGVMTDAVRNTLLTDTSIDAQLPMFNPLAVQLVSTKTDYQNAINSLHAKPRTFIGKEMKFFREPVFTVPLAVLPGEINFAAQLPQELSAKIFFDGERQLLQFTGMMTSAEKIALKSLSLSPTDPLNIAYEAAIDTLSTFPPPTTDLWIEPTDVDALFDNPVPLNVVANLKSVIAEVYDYLRPVVSEAFVIQQFSENLGLSPAVTEKLLRTFNLFGTQTAHSLIVDFTETAFVTSTDALTHAAHADRHLAYYWLHRVALVIRKIKVSFSDLEWIILRHTPADVLYFKTLPLVYNATVPAVASLSAFLNLSDYMQMHHLYSDADISMLGIVEKVITAATYDNVAFSKDVESLTGWNAADIKHLTDAGVLDVSYPTAYQKILNWKRLEKAVAMTDKLNGSAQALRAFAAATVGQAESLGVKQMLRSKYEPEQWLEISRDIQDELRHRKRDSLVAFLLTQPMPADAPTKKWENANDLYAYYLIDVEMCSCQLTSRIVQALAAIQLFVQRCFMGLEPRVRVSVEEDDSWKQYKWMKNYRVWGANRKVFLYPENWIEPGLRGDKTEFFRDLENELLQNELNRDNVETAFLNYIEKLDGVAQLEIAGTFYQEDNHTLHVFARTPGSEPHVYYYRQWIDERRWTPWSKVECDIKGDYLIPIVMEQRLYLVWPEFREEPVEVNTVNVPSAGKTSFAVQKPLKTTLIHLAISENRNKKWSPKKVSKDFIDAGQYQGQTLDKSLYLFLPLDFTDLPGGKFLIFFQDQSPAFRDVSPPPSQIFELLGCKGYPEKSVAPFNFMPNLTRFDRDVIRYLRNSEWDMARSVSQALVPYNSRYLQSTILEKTPDYFKISYPHYLSYFDKLFVGFSTAIQFGNVNRNIQFTLGTFYNWFYADKARTFFVRQQLLAKDGSAVFYKELEALVKDILELLQAGKFHEAQDKLRRVYQSNYQFRLLFRIFYHPFTCLFAKQLYNQGVDGLMSRETQFADNNLNFRNVYGPMPVVNTNYPQEVVDFTPDGSYSQYNWELFFHAPLMIAMRLSKDQQFEEAMRWFHYIFDPTSAHDRDPLTGAPAPVPQRYWNLKPFYQTTSKDYVDQRIDNILKMLADDPANPTDPAVKQELVNQVADWRANAFDPHLIAQFRTVAYQKTTVMKYIDNLIAWGDQLFRQDTMESINEAAQLYCQAAEILGPMPRKVPPPQKPAVESFNELEGKLDAFSNAIVNFENLIPVVSGNASSGTNGQPLPSLLYFCIPQNDQLLRYWDTVADRLYKIRHCQNIEGVIRQLALFAPEIDPGALVRAAAAGLDISSALSDLNTPLPHYRFNVMLQKANEVVNDVKALGGALLSAWRRRTRKRWRFCARAMS